MSINLNDARDGGFCGVFGPVPAELPFGYDEEHSRCAEIKLKLLFGILDRLAKGSTLFASTLDQGAAMWAAEACIALRDGGMQLSFIAVPRSEEQSSKWHPERRERYYSLLEEADRVVCPQGLGAEEYIIANSSVAIVVGEPSAARTARLIDLLDRAGIPTLVL